MRRNLRALEKTTAERGARGTSDAKSLPATFVGPVFFVLTSDTIVLQLALGGACQRAMCNGARMRKNFSTP